MKILRTIFIKTLRFVKDLDEIDENLTIYFGEEFYLEITDKTESKEHSFYAAEMVRSLVRSCKKIFGFPLIITFDFVLREQVKFTPIEPGIWTKNIILHHLTNK